MIAFKKAGIEDLDQIASYFYQSEHNACDYTPANFILWSDVYQTEYAVIHDMLVGRFKKGGNTHFTVPVGAGDRKKAIDCIMEYCNEKGIKFYMNIVEPEMEEEIEALYPGQFLVTYDEDYFDYVYLREDLVELKGKKYHGKKNHINKFHKNNPHWSYESMTDENIGECIAMVKAWCVENQCCEDKEKAAEMCILINAIENRSRLHLTGGIVRGERGICGLAMGEPCSKNSFVVHFEKAFASEQGAYPMINQQFALHAMQEYEYVNREEDMGVPGLRKAKESYYPVHRVKKGILAIKGQE